jgi:hypothetical protein
VLAEADSSRKSFLVTPMVTSVTWTVVPEVVTFVERLMASPAERGVVV